MAETEDTKQSKRPGMKFVAIVLALLFVGALATSGVLYVKYRQAQGGEQAQAEKLVSRLAKVVELPGAKPTVVTVTDKSKLSNQALATRVASADKLLIYTEDKRIVIYRPSSGKVVDMLSFEAQAELPQGQDATSAPAATPSPAPKKP